MTFNMTDKESNIVKRWAPVIAKFGKLESEGEKLELANLLESFREKATANVETGVCLGDGEYVYVNNSDMTRRFRVTYSEKDGFTTLLQHKDWVDD